MFVNFFFILKRKILLTFFKGNKYGVDFEKFPRYHLEENAANTFYLSLWWGLLGMTFETKMQNMSDL